MFGSALPAAGSKVSPAETRLRQDLDEEIKKRSHKKRVAEKPPSLEELGGEAKPATQEDPPAEPAVEEPDASSSEGEAAAGFWLGNPDEESKKKSKKDKKKHKKAKKDSKKKKHSKEDKKKKKKPSSSSDSSSSSSGSSSSVFRVIKTGNDRISQARMIQWAEDHPGKTALELLRKMHVVVGQDGEKAKKIGSAPAVAKQYDLRVLRQLEVSQGKAYLRNQRELTTMCVMLDHMALGRYKQAADVMAARLKSVEAGIQTGNFETSAFLELVAVNPEGLTTVDEKLLIKNESMLNHKSSSPHSSTWMGHGKGNGSNSSYRWNPSGGGKNKKGGGKGKKNGKGRKGDKKDRGIIEGSERLQRQWAGVQPESF